MRETIKRSIMEDNNIIFHYCGYEDAERTKSLGQITVNALKPQDEYNSKVSNLMDDPRLLFLDMKDQKGKVLITLDLTRMRAGKV